MTFFVHIDFSTRETPLPRELGQQKQCRKKRQNGRVHQIGLFCVQNLVFDHSRNRHFFVQQNCVLKREFEGIIDMVRIIVQNSARFWFPANCTSSGAKTRRLPRFPIDTETSTRDSRGFRFY